MSGTDEITQKTAGIIGLGKIGMFYDLQLFENDIQLTHAKALAVHPNFNLVFGVDPAAEAREIFEERFGGMTFPSVQDALSEFRPDLIVIATPTQSLPTICKAVYDFDEHSVVLVEKPMASTSNEAREVLRKSQNGSIFVNYMRQSNPSVIKVGELLSTGQIEPPFTVTIWYPGSTLNGASHFITLCIGWFGPVMSTQTESMYPHVLNSAIGVNFTLNFRDAKVYFIPTAQASLGFSKVFLLARNGVLKSNNTGTGFTWHPAQTDPLYGTAGSWSEDGESLGGNPALTQRYVYDELIRFFRGSGASLCTTDRALQTLEVVEEIMSQVA